MKKESITTTKVVIVTFGSILVMVLAQVLALFLANLICAIGVPTAFCNLLAGIFYVLFTYLGLKVLCEKMLKIPLGELRITKISLKPVWVISAFLMPFFVCAFFVLQDGKWINYELGGSKFWIIFMATVFYYGFAAGIVEEMVFRGVIFSSFEQCFGRVIAVILPSIVFGTIHMLDRELSVLSMIQLCVGGTIVGILFSLVACHGGNIWNNALMHAVWNMVMAGGILHIGTEENQEVFCNYVLSSDSFLLTGGDFGIEASLPTIVVYLIFIVLAVYLLNRENAKKS